MAQDFRNALVADVATITYTGSNSADATTLWTGGNYDAIIGLRFANVSTSQVNISVLLVNSGDFFLIKDAPIPAGSSLELIDSGSKIVMKSGDVLKAYASAASAVDAIISAVDTISA